MPIDGPKRPPRNQLVSVGCVLDNVLVVGDPVLSGHDVLCDGLAGSVEAHRERAVHCSRLVLVQVSAESGSIEQVWMMGEFITDYKIRNFYYTKNANLRMLFWPLAGTT